MPENSMNHPDGVRPQETHGGEAPPHSENRAVNRWRRESEVFLQGSYPEISDLPEGARWKAWRYRMLWTTAVAVVALVASTLFPVFLSLNDSVKQREARAEDAANDKLQSEKPLLSTHVRYEDTRGVWEKVDSLHVLFDTPFSTQETKALEGLNLRKAADFDKLYEVINKGRPTLETRFNPYPTVNESGYSQPFYLDITSERDSPVEITEMKSEEEGCTKSRVRTVLHIPTQGVSPIDGIIFGLQRLGSSRAVIPEGEDNSETGGDPYFDHEVIFVGGSQAPVTLDVNGAVREGWRCEWKIRATYNTQDSKGKSAVIDNGGKPLISEGLPSNPTQYWVVDPVKAKVVECYRRPEGSDYCAFL